MGALQRASLHNDIDNAEIIVAELAANVEKRARPPYELRVFSLEATPTWCEVVDGDPATQNIRCTFDRLGTLNESDLPSPHRERPQPPINSLEATP